jgi:hypothetical protein
MFGKQCLKRGSTALLLFVALAAGGCGTTTVYQATPEGTRDLSPAQARKQLIKTAQSASGCIAPTKLGAVNYDNYQSTYAGPYRFAGYHAFVAMLYVGDPEEGRAANRTCINVSEVPVKRATREGMRQIGDCVFYRRGDNFSAAGDFVRAWHVWAARGLPSI